MRIRLIILFLLLAVLTGSAFTVSAQQILGNLVPTATIEANPFVAPVSRFQTDQVARNGKWTILDMGELKLFHVTTVNNGQSMIPIIGAGGYVLAAPVKGETDIGKLLLGDIVIIALDLTKPLDATDNALAHQIIGFGADSTGWYAETKGTGNLRRDFVQWRKENIKYLVRVILY